MERRKVESTNVAAVGYDEETQTLEVEFKPSKNGVVNIWQYAPVELSLYEIMIDPSQSVGKLVASIKQSETVTATHVGTITPAEVV